MAAAPLLASLSRERAAVDWEERRDWVVESFRLRARDFEREEATAFSADWTRDDGGRDDEEDDMGSATMRPKSWPESTRGRTRAPVLGRTMSSSSRMEGHRSSNDSTKRSLLLLCTSLLVEEGPGLSAVVLLVEEGPGLAVVELRSSDGLLAIESDHSLVQGIRRGEDADVGS